MRAVLLAGGVGSRIKEIKIPKCTLKINDTPIIYHTIQMLLNYGIKVAVVTGYKDSEVIETIKPLGGVEIFHNPFYRITNSIASLWFAREFAYNHNEDLILANADVLWDEYILDCLLNSNYDRTMISDSSKVKDGIGDFFFKLKGSFVVDYGKELTLTDRDTEYVGIAKIKNTSLISFKEKMEELIHNEKYDMWWENILYEDLKTNKVFSLDINGHRWGEVDSIEDYQRLQRVMKKGL